MEIPTQEQLLERIDAFLTRHSYADTRFGREATGEPNLLTTLRGGRSPSLRTMHRIFDFMTEKDREAGHDDADIASGAAGSSGTSTGISQQVTA